jgi:hypothetical protein
MRKILVLMLFSCFLLSFSILKSKKNTPSFTIAFVKETYIDKKESREKVIRNLIGVFPKDNDTTSIYQLNSYLTEKPQIFSYWVTNKNNNPRYRRFAIHTESNYQTQFIIHIPFSNFLTL